jgi:hypothetical protein
VERFRSNGGFRHVTLDVMAAGQQSPSVWTTRSVRPSASSSSARDLSSRTWVSASQPRPIAHRSADLAPTAASPGGPQACAVGRFRNERTRSTHLLAPTATFDAAASSSRWVTQPRPRITDSGRVGDRRTRWALRDDDRAQGNWAGSGDRPGFGGRPRGWRVIGPGATGTYGSHG